MDPERDELLPTRQSLLGRLKNWDDQESWRDFFETYWKLIYSVALKAGLNEFGAQDVVQETMFSVAKAINQFRYDPALGSFKGWLLQITRRRIVDQLRKFPPEFFASNAARREPDRTPTAERIPDPAEAVQEAIWDEEWQKNLVGTAIEKVKRQVKPKQYQMFDCFVIKRWPMREVIEKLRVNRGQVYFAKFKITALIQKEITNLRKKWPS